MTAEHYKLTCAHCDKTVSVRPVDGAQPCPNCGEMLNVAWAAERRDYDGRPKGVA